MSFRNPFLYDRPLAPEDVTGRQGLTERLLDGIRDRRLVAVVAPRRYGKTSLLGHVASIAGDVDALPVVTVDCYGTASDGDFAVRLESALTELQGPAHKAVAALLRSSELGLSAAPGVGFKATFGRKNAADPTAAVHALLDALAALAEKRSGLVLVLDEFQDVARVDGLDALLRTHLQRARDIAVLFAGSSPSMMRTLFTERARPFFGQAELIEVPPFDLDTAAAIVDDAFARTDRDPGPAGDLIARAVAGHPQRLMLVAHLLWALTSPGQVVDEEMVASALAEAHRRTDPEHQAVVDGLPRSHRDALRAVVAYGSPMSRTAGRTLGLSRSTAQSASEALVREALLRRDGDGWVLVDPFLADWLRDRLPLLGG